MRRPRTVAQALVPQWMLLSAVLLLVALQGGVLVGLALSASWHNDESNSTRSSGEQRPRELRARPAAEELCERDWPEAREVRSPPERIPADMLDSFTMHGKVTPTFSYLAQVPRGNAHVWNDHVCKRYYGLAENRRPGYYGKTDVALWSALEDYPVRGLSVGVFGSVSPLYEATAAVHKAASVMTVEYNAIRQDCEWGRAVGLQTATVRDFWAVPDDQRQRFDAVFSISSFEHDGLGRYGDPIDAHGDLRAISKLQRALKPNGLLYLAVPMNLVEDGLVWNLQRIYGPLRWPMLISGWRLLNIYGVDAGCARRGETCQPVAVLRNCH